MDNRKIIGWITINGVHRPIFEGESSKDAYSRIKQSNLNNKKLDISYTSSIKKEDVIKKYGITEQEKDSVGDYSSDGYIQINTELKDSKGNLNECSRLVEEKCKNIDRLLKKLPKYSGEVARKEPATMRDFYKEGHIYTNDFYTSTTAWGSTGGVVELHIKQSKGCNISKLSNSPGENEVLLPRGFQYKVTKVTKTSSGYVTVYAEEI